MISRVLSYGFFLAAFVLFAVAGYGYYLSSDGPGVAFVDPVSDFPNLAVGENVVTYRLHNPTRHMARVVGCSFC